MQLSYLVLLAAQARFHAFHIEPVLPGSVLVRSQLRRARRIALSTSLPCVSIVPGQCGVLQADHFMPKIAVLTLKSHRTLRVRDLYGETILQNRDLPACVVQLLQPLHHLRFCFPHLLDMLRTLTAFGWWGPPSAGLDAVDRLRGKRPR